MVTNMGVIMKSRFIILAVGLMGCVGVRGYAQEQALLELGDTPVLMRIPLNVGLRDMESPIRTSDPVRLYANTSDQVFVDGGQNVHSTFLVNGFDIEWNIFSESHDGPRFAAHARLFAQLDLDPLPVGTYQVNAAWTNLDRPEQGPRRIGAASFTVVPEPSTLTLALFGLLGSFGVIRWRRKRRN